MIEKIELIDEKWKSVQDEFSGESERACAIVGSAYLDDLLGQILEKYLVENKDTVNELISGENATAPLGSFGSRILAAYAFGLIQENEFNLLRKIKSIRNKFAHNLSLSFDDQSISAQCLNIKELLNFVDLDEREYSSREIFILAISFIIGHLKAILNLLEKHNISGGFEAVFLLNVAYSKLQNKK